MSSLATDKKFIIAAISIATVIGAIALVGFILGAVSVSRSNSPFTFSYQNPSKPSPTAAIVEKFEPKQLLGDTYYISDRNDIDFYKNGSARTKIEVIATLDDATTPSVLFSNSTGKDGQFIAKVENNLFKVFFNDGSKTGIPVSLSLTNPFVIKAGVEYAFAFGFYNKMLWSTIDNISLTAVSFTRDFDGVIPNFITLGAYRPNSFTSSYLVKGKISALKIWMDDILTWSYRFVNSSLKISNDEKDKMIFSAVTIK